MTARRRPRGSARFAWRLAMTEPWAITRTGWLQAHEAAAGLPLLANLEGRDRRLAPVRDGVALLPVRGVLRSRDYERLGAWLGAALARPDVHAVLLDINSPGGQIFGCGELADRVHRVGRIKPVHAYVSFEACAGAYWIASAAARIGATETAIVGGFGFVTTVTDRRVADARAGIQRIDVVSTETPQKVPDPKLDTGRAQLRRTLDALAGVMLANVTRYRPTLAARPRATWADGRVHVGRAAVAVGLADELTNTDAAIARLATMR